MNKKIYDFIMRLKAVVAHEEARAIAEAWLFKNAFSIYPKLKLNAPANF